MKHCSRSHNRGVFVIKAMHYLFVCSLLSIFIVGCSSNSPTEKPNTVTPPPLPPSSPEPPVPVIEPEPSVVRLPDGSEIFLDPDAYIEILKLDGFSTESDGHEILLHRGKVEVESQLSEGTWFTIFSRDYYLARVTGSTITVIFDQETGQFMFECGEGVCEFGSDIDNLDKFEIGQKGCMDEDGHMFGPFSGIDFDELSAVCIYTEREATPTTVPTATYSPEPSATPDNEATATASCQDFESQFPGTPCP